MTNSVIIRHSFETGHRLPFLGGKCENLHGHSWEVSATISAPTTAAGIVIEFGKLKREVREWIDGNLDHGVMLGKDDPLVPVLTGYGKVFIFDPRGASTPGLAWPTVENVAVMLGNRIERIVQTIERAPDTHLEYILVQETKTNASGWRPSW